MGNVGLEVPRRRPSGHIRWALSVLKSLAAIEQGPTGQMWDELDKHPVFQAITQALCIVAAALDDLVESACRPVLL